MKHVTAQKLFWNALFIANLYAIGYIWLLGSADLLQADTSGVLIALGRLAGLLLEYGILIELVLISRLHSLERLYGFDRQNILHRGLGFFLVVFVVVHPLLLSYGYALQNSVGAWEQFASFVVHWRDIFPALVAVLLMIVLGILALPHVRQWLSYETWYFAHVPMYGAIALAFSHQLNTGDVASGSALYYWLVLNFAVFGIVLVYRFLVPLYKNWKHAFRVSRVVREAPDVVSVHLSGRRMREFRFEAGQWARLVFLQKDMWHGHPFSFSAPYNGTEVRFSIKALGDWTAHAGELAPGTRVWLEGPYGALTLGHARTRKYLFIAGGIGITPLLALVRSLPRNTDAFLCYGVRMRDDLLFTKELAKSDVRRAYFLGDEVCEGYEHGNITLPRVLSLCPDALSRDVYLCGPPLMLSALSHAFLEAGLPKEQLHVERFGL